MGAEREPREKAPTISLAAAGGAGLARGLASREDLARACADRFIRQACAARFSSGLYLGRCGSATGVKMRSRAIAGRVGGKCKELRFR